MHFSAFGNSVTNPGNTNARIKNPRELGVICEKKDSINFKWFNNYYWSSTELNLGGTYADVDSVYAKSISMMAGKTIYNMKVEGYNVVCIRKD
jgi:hypothetical protein